MTGGVLWGVALLPRRPRVERGTPGGYRPCARLPCAAVRVIRTSMATRDTRQLARKPGSFSAVRRRRFGATSHTGEAGPSQVRRPVAMWPGTAVHPHFRGITLRITLAKGRRPWPPVRCLQLGQAEQLFRIGLALSGKHRARTGTTDLDRAVVAMRSLPDPEGPSMETRPRGAAGVLPT